MKRAVAVRLDPQTEPEARAARLFETSRSLREQNATKFGMLLSIRRALR
jgi:hypothetical protein